MKNYICKRTKNGSVVILDRNMLSGLNFNPKNNNNYGISVSKMIIVKPDIVKKLLIKSTKRKLDKFIEFLAGLTDDDDTTDASLREALNDLSRYRNIVEYKYKKYLDEKYQEQLIAKIDILEGEIKKKLIYGDNEKSLNKIYQEMYKNMIANMYLRQEANTYENEKENRRTR